jgi:hypothetical protein
MKISQLKAAAVGPDSLTQHLQGSASFYLIEETFEKAALGIRSAGPLELLPLLGLRGIEKGK